MSNGIRINMSEKEAASESREMEPLPTAKYFVAVTDAEEAECGPESKNPGKPYYKFEFTVQDGQYEGRKMWTNAMLFEGALFTIVNMLKAQGIDVRPNGWFQVEGYEECVVPEPGWWLGKQFVVFGKKTTGKIKDQATKERYPDRTEPKGFWHGSTWAGAPAATVSGSQGSASILP